MKLSSANIKSEEVRKYKYVKNFIDALKKSSNYIADVYINHHLAISSVVHFIEIRNSLIACINGLVSFTKSIYANHINVKIHKSGSNDIIMQSSTRINECIEIGDQDVDLYVPVINTHPYIINNQYVPKSKFNMLGTNRVIPVDLDSQPSDDGDDDSLDIQSLYEMKDLSQYGLNIEMCKYEVSRACVYDTLGSSYELDSLNYPTYPITNPTGFDVDNPETLLLDGRPIQITGPDDPLIYTYCNALSRKNNLEPYYEEDENGNATSNKSQASDAEYGYRLPTKDEWEFAANAGTPNSLYSGPKWTEDDLDGGIFKDTQYSDYFILTYDFINVEDADYVEYSSRNTPVYCWDKLPTSSEKITNVIIGFAQDSDNGTSPQNFGMPDLSRFAWTRYGLYRDNEASKLSDVPMILVSDAYFDDGKDKMGHAWTPNPSTSEKDNQFTVFKIGDNYYKTNVYGWHNRIGDKDNDFVGTHAVNKLECNNYGLYDMTGNVAELDQEGFYKGGSFASNQQFVLNTCDSTKNDVKGIIGFRVCRTIPKSHENSLELAYDGDKNLTIRLSKSKDVAKSDNVSSKKIRFEVCENDNIKYYSEELISSDEEFISAELLNNIILYDADTDELIGKSIRETYGRDNIKLFGQIDYSGLPVYTQPAIVVESRSIRNTDKLPAILDTTDNGTDLSSVILTSTEYDNYSMYFKFNLVSDGDQILDPFGYWEGIAKLYDDNNTIIGSSGLSEKNRDVSASKTLEYDNWHSNYKDITLEIGTSGDGDSWVTNFNNYVTVPSGHEDGQKLSAVDAVAGTTFKFRALYADDMS